MRLLPDELSSLFRTGFLRSISSLLIKVATAGLTYISFVVLSRTMSVEQYGYFALALALATVLAIVAGVGQQTAILRFWAEERATGHPDRAEAALRAGGALTITASLGLGAVIIAMTAIYDTLSAPVTPSWHLYAIAALVLPMALSEYNSSALRAQGSIWTALAPRDLLWRILLPLAAIAIAWAGFELAGWGAVLLSGGLLLVCLALQYALAPRRRYTLRPGQRALREYWRLRGGASRWFLIGGVINSLALNADTVLVGALADPESAGAYFNAFRTAGLMTLFSFAISLVIAPMIAQFFHGGEHHKAQAALAMGTWAGFLFSLVAFVGLVLFGDRIMALFGPAYADAAPILMVLGLGFLFDAGGGPSRTVLMMTGHERRFALIFGVMVVLSLAVQAAVLPVFGLMGVALANSIGRAVAYGLLSAYCMRHVGLDPTIFGIFRINRESRRSEPVRTVR